MCWFVVLVQSTKASLTFCNSMDYSTPDSSVLHYLPEFARIHVHWVDDAISPHHPLAPPFLLPSDLPSIIVFSSIRVFSNESVFTSGGQSIGASASVSVLPVNIQGWFPLGLTGLISLQSKGPSRVFSNTTVQKHQFFNTQPKMDKAKFWIYC